MAKALANPLARPDDAPLTVAELTVGAPIGDGALQAHVTEGPWTAVYSNARGCWCAVNRAVRPPLVHPCVSREAARWNAAEANRLHAEREASLRSDWAAYKAEMDRIQYEHSEELPARTVDAWQGYYRGCHHTVVAQPSGDPLLPGQRARIVGMLDFEGKCPACKAERQVATSSKREYRTAANWGD